MIFFLIIILKRSSRNSRKLTKISFGNRGKFLGRNNFRNSEKNNSEKKLRGDHVIKSYVSRRFFFIILKNFFFVTNKKRIRKILFCSSYRSRLGNNIQNFKFKK